MDHNANTIELMLILPCHSTTTTFTIEEEKKAMKVVGRCLWPPWISQDREPHRYSIT